MTDHRVDEAKGRVKEATGALTDDEELEREGERDQGKSDVKEKIDAAADKAKKAVDDLSSKLSR